MLFRSSGERRQARQLDAHRGARRGERVDHRRQRGKPRLLVHLVVGRRLDAEPDLFLSDVVAHWAARGFPGLVYCLEMAIEELVQHVLCAYYRLPEEV